MAVLNSIIEPKLGRRYQEIAAAVQASNAPADRLASDSKLKRLISALAEWPRTRPGTSYWRPIRSMPGLSVRTKFTGVKY